MGAVATELSAEQRRSGIESSVWCVDAPEVAASVGPPDDIVPLPVFGPRRFAFSPVSERRARNIRTDVVHQHGLWTAQTRVTEVFRARHIPTIIAPHGSLEPYARRHSARKKRIALAWFESRNLHLASCLHATTEAELRTFRNFGLRRPVAVVPPGIASSWLEACPDPARFKQRHGLDDGRRIMLFLSRIDTKKGLPLLIEALAMHRQRLEEWRVVIAGPDVKGHRANVEALAERLGVASSIRFVGPVFDRDKRDAFAAADVFVLPTHSENFGIVIVEALASGVPVITTRGTPWSELEVHRCGWWVPPDSRSIGDALIDAARRSDAELRAMGARGRALVESRYLWSAVAERMTELYGWLLGEAQKPSFVAVD